jgi:hypothetical protein
MRGRGKRGGVAVLAAASLAALAGTQLAGAGNDPGQNGNGNNDNGPSAAASGCHLANGIKHVITITFDNTHLTRDRRQFLSDLEQMPNLRDYVRSNGTLSDNHHTILISHTAGGILTSLTGLYPDRNGITVSNSYRYFKTDATGVRTSSSVGAFKYWTDLVDSEGVPPADALPNMVTDGGKNTPAPWVPWTRAGCNFGAVSTANIVLENTSTGPNGDMTKVFGAGSPESTEAKANPSLAQTDFVGIAVHCANGGGICTGNANARPDQLPDEPGGYVGYQALFGAKYVNPAITGGQTAVKDTNGNDIKDPAGNPGFPGFDGMPAAVSLGYVAQMQENGIPVTFAYISDAHDKHPTGPAYGPGEPGYVQALQEYNKAFGDFFARLKAHGIDKSNTLFVVTSDENDHFAGGDSADGTWSHTTCNVDTHQTCPANQIGEVSQNIVSALPADPARPRFFVHSDSAPTYYVDGQPVATDPKLRKLEREVAAMKGINPYVDPVNPQRITLWMADPVAQRTLHMVNADPNRTPSFTQFANPDYFLSTFDTNCPDSTHRAHTCVDYHFAWSHGDATDDIGRTWLGLVGPGVRTLGETSRVWSDHTDVQPTILSLVGLQDSYVPDGRVLTETLSGGQQDATLTQLGEVYKQITAPFGPLAKDVLVASTKAISSGSSTDDSTYARISGQIDSLTTDRNDAAAQMRTVLTDASFGGNFDDGQARGLIRRGNDLLAQAHDLAAHS